MTRKSSSHPRQPLLPVERHRRSRRKQLSRLFGAMVTLVAPLHAIAGRPGMPSLAKLQRWFSRDAEFQKGFEHAFAIAEEQRCKRQAAFGRRRRAPLRG